MKTILKIFIVIIYFVLNACSANISENNSFTISGSDTMFDLTSNLAAEYMKEHPGIAIKVIGGGTASGIRALIKGETYICTASRNLKPDEAKALADYYNSLGMVFLMAKDGLSIYLHPENNVKNLSMSQIKNIFTGKINNWKVLGGKDTVIIPVIRNPNSGTYLYFKEHVLQDEEYSSDCLIEPTTKEIAKFVSEHTNAIGYGGMGYSLNVFNAAVNGVEPLEKNIQNDTYPISRYLHFFTTNNPKGLIKNFIDWVLSPAGQSVVRKSGYIPLWENQL